MKLHSPQFQRQLRRNVKKTIRASQELKKEYRQAKKYRRHFNIGWALRFVFSFGLGAGVLAIVKATGHPISGLAAIALWSFASVFFYAQRLWDLLYKHFDIPALRLLPVSEETIFRWQLQKFLPKSLWLLLDLVMGLGALGSGLGFSVSQWLLLPLLLLVSWGTLLALVALCAIHVPEKVRQMTAGAIWIFGFLLFFAVRTDAKLVFHVLDQIAPDLTVLLPTGWPVLLFQLLLPGGSEVALLALVPVAILLVSLKYSFARLQNDFRYEEYILPMVADIVPAASARDSTSAGLAPPQNLGLTAIEEIVVSRQFLAPVPWSQRGWLEKQLWNWLDAREKALCEFAFPKGYAITVPWWKTIRNLGVAVAAAVILGLGSTSTGNWILGIGLFLTVSQALGQIMSGGATFRPVFCSGVNIPLYAGYGLGYRELSRLLFKCTAIQLPLFIPFITLCVILATWLFQAPWQAGVLFGFKAGILMSAGRFILVLFAFSSGTNDGSKFRLRTLILFGVIIGLGATFLVLGAAGFLVPDAPVAWGLLFLAVLTAYIMFRAYGWFYHANHFDLMNLPRR